MGSVKRLLATFGNGDLGRLGHGCNAAELIPRVVASLKDECVQAVACGSAHTLAVGKDGSVYSCGLNSAGQLGHSHGQDASLEMKEILLPEGTVAVAAGSEHSLMLLESGDVWAVGRNHCGQLGLGRSGDSSSGMPRRIPALAGAKVSQIAACMDHSLAVTTAGEVLSWGAGGSGQLGHGSAAVPMDRNESAPRLVSALKGRKMIQASAGFLHSGALEDDGSVWMWGGNPYWQLGGPSLPQSSDPIRIDLKSCQGLALHGNHSMALLRNGGALVWGPNENGLLGLGSAGPTSCRTPTPIPKLSFSQISSGWRHCGGVAPSGRVYTWGWGGAEGTSSMMSTQASSGGQLGLGNEFDFWKPTPVSHLLDCDGNVVKQEAEQDGDRTWRAVDISCGLNHSAVIVDIETS